MSILHLRFADEALRPETRPFDCVSHTVVTRGPAGI